MKSLITFGMMPPLEAQSTISSAVFPAAVISTVCWPMALSTSASAGAATGVPLRLACYVAQSMLRIEM